MRVSREEFEALVEKALEGLPEEFQEALDNVAVMVEEEPSEEDLDGVGIDPDDPDVDFGDVAVPTLMIWGNQDQAIGRKSNDDAAQYHKGPYRWVELDAGHWLIQERFEDVSREILAHLESNRAG